MMLRDVVVDQQSRPTVNPLLLVSDTP